mmetsp:Transcript_6991/g.15313  ORF Transcript_6991/g.15313 Transcript_6991/m.15313 type:complete len:286 (-) Transcript_6991:406-1263(-)
MPKRRPINFASFVRHPKPKRKPVNFRSTLKGFSASSSSSASGSVRLGRVMLRSQSVSLPPQMEALSTSTPSNLQLLDPSHAPLAKSGSLNSASRSRDPMPSGKSHIVTKIAPPTEVRKQDLQGMWKRRPINLARRVFQPKPKKKPTKLSLILKGFLRPDKSEALNVKFGRAHVSLPVQGTPKSALTPSKEQLDDPSQAFSAKSGASNSSSRSREVMPSGKSHIVTKILPPTAVRKQERQGMPKRRPISLASRKRQPKPKKKPMNLSSILNGFVRLPRSAGSTETL